MLEFFFEKDTRLRQLRRGPLGPYMDGLSAELRRGRYSKSSARRILSLAARLSQFARASGLQDAAGIDAQLISRFLTEELAAEGKFREGPNMVLHVTAFLQRLGVLQSTRIKAPDDPETRLLAGYDTYLRDVRGLQTSTRWRVSARRAAPSEVVHGTVRQRPPARQAFRVGRAGVRDRLYLRVFEWISG